MIQKLCEQHTEAIQAFLMQSHLHLLGTDQADQENKNHSKEEVFYVGT